MKSNIINYLADILTILRECPDDPEDHLCDAIDTLKDLNRLSSRIKGLEENIKELQKDLDTKYEFLFYRKHDSKMEDL